jgi:hypothetical protein
MPNEGSNRSDVIANLDERQPLLGNGPKPASEEPPLTDLISKDAPNLKIVLPCLMVCAFLAAFDITVIASIYSIMSLNHCS